MLGLCPTGISAGNSNQTWVPIYSSVPYRGIHAVRDKLWLTFIIPKMGKPQPWEFLEADMYSIVCLFPGLEIAV